MVLVLFSTKVLFFVHVNQSFSCIRSCRTDLVSIVFSVFLLIFLVICILLYFKLSFLESFRFAFINSVFFFSSFAVIFLVNRKVKRQI